MLEECITLAEIDLDDVATARAASPMLADLEAMLTDVVLELEALARNPHGLPKDAAQESCDERTSNH